MTTSSPPPWAAALVHQGREAVAAFDETGVVAYANTAAEEVLGLAPGSMAGTNAFDLVHPEDLARAAANVAGISSGARPLPGLIRLRRRDGSWVLYEVSPYAVDLPGPPEGPGPLTTVTIRDTALQDAHWNFLTALSSGEDLHHCFTVLASGLSSANDGPMGVSYDSGGRRRVAGPLDPVLAGLRGDGGLDTTPGTPWADALRSGRPVALPTATLPEPWQAAGLDVGEACVVVPVLDPSGGAPALIVQWPPQEAMATLLAEALARRPRQAVTLALDRRDAQQRLEHLAHHDGLTGLLNRNRFFAVLADLGEQDRPYGVLYVDLDRFKPINDTLGHVIGDHALVVCARRLQRLAGPDDVVARVGGDEFVLACPDLTHDELAERAEEVVARLGQPFRIADHLVDVGASVGGARTAGGDAPDAVVAAADIALYTAKRAGRSTWRVADAIGPAPDGHEVDPARWADLGTAPDHA